MSREQMLEEGKRIQNKANFRRMGTESLAELVRIDNETDDAMHELYLRFQAAQK